MTYYCFLCNKEHDGDPTDEHFIPRSIDAPEAQKPPVCSEMNSRANSIFDNHARDILYLVRFRGTHDLKRHGEAVFADGTVKPFRFCYREEGFESVADSEFAYIFDIAENELIPQEGVYAIHFQVGLTPREIEIFCCGIAKITLGAVVFLLQRRGVPQEDISRLLSHTEYNALRHIALGHPWTHQSVGVRFSLGNSYVLETLHGSCECPEVRNHVVSLSIKESGVQVDGMLYSQYGWQIALPSHEGIPADTLRLENAITDMPSPNPLRDLSLCLDSICVVNPAYVGEVPLLPEHWQNRA